MEKKRIIHQFEYNRIDVRKVKSLFDFETLTNYGNFNSQISVHIWEIKSYSRIVSLKKEKKKKMVIIRVEKMYNNGKL